MASKINILSDALMKRIAAGEVVERPASVAKELMENSIDADATSITLIVKGSGSDIIQVVDNGEGMPEEDVLICTARHATSKISHEEDLEAIHTLGFRGEALSSIASVSRMVITTCTRTDTEGTQVHVEGGVIREVLKVAANPGTNVEVKTLFYNVPARKKFLKHQSTELRRIITAFRRLALSHPHIDFSLFIEDEKTMDLISDTQENRVRALMRSKNDIKFIELEKQIGNLSLEGFLSRPGEGRKTRDDQFIFLNRRYIVSKSIVHAILSAYGPKLGSNEYPIFVLFMKMDPHHYDANVHPTKIEVRFKDEKFIHDVTHRAVKEALGSVRSVRDFQIIQGKGRNDKAFRPPLIYPEDHGQMTLEVQRPLHESEGHTPAWIPEKPSVFWQVHNRYIFSQIKSGITIIDQHVAHERILYERVRIAREKQAGLSQQLLFPQTVQVGHEDFLVLMEITPYLEKIGFGLKDFGKNTVVIEAVPVDIKNGHERELLLDIIDEYKNLRTDNDDIWDSVAKAFACKSAIKSGDSLTLIEMAELIDQLFATQDPYYCPHGRPVVINLPLEEIDKRFGR